MTNGRSQPPKKRITVRKLTVMTWRYSPRKNRPNFIAEYSVWKPPTSSCSDSGRSNGSRLVSAKALTRNSRKPSGWTKIPQTWRSCHSIIVLRSSEPQTRIIPRIDIPSGISYEINWALDRRPPRNEYLLFDAQPARITP